MKEHLDHLWRTSVLGTASGLVEGTGLEEEQGVQAGLAGGLSSSMSTRMELMVLSLQMDLRLQVPVSVSGDLILP